MNTDYTKCSGEGCPIKQQCHRFTGPTEPSYQSWLMEVPGKWHDDVLNKQVWECDLFWNNNIKNTFDFISNGTNTNNII